MLMFDVDGTQKPLTDGLLIICHLFSFTGQALAMAAKLLPGEVITPHHDSHPSFYQRHRIHTPIVTNSRVRFMIDGRAYQFKVGEAYEINNQKAHSVMNKGKEGWINFIFD